MKLILLIACTFINYCSIGQTKFSYNAKGGMLKASFSGSYPCPVQTGRAAPAELNNEAMMGRQVQQETKKELLSLSVTPNPAKSNSKVEVYIPASGSFTLRLTNAVGITLITVSPTSQKAGSFTHLQDVRLLPAGTYWWVLSTGEQVKAVQWVKM